MNCLEWEERIALYAGGDLAPADAAAVERHLGECAGCQLFASGMRDSLRVLREAHADEVDAAALTAVRVRVMAKLEPRAWWRRGWVYGFATAAAAVLLVLMWWPRQVHAPARVAVREQVVTQKQKVTAEQAELAAPGATPKLHRARAVRRTGAIKRAPVVKTVAQAPATPLVVKMMTDDPDVVIYWITETRGETR